VVEERRGHFKSKASNSWATVRPSDPSLAPTPSPEPEDDLPVVVNLAPVSRGGLQSAADLRAENDRRAVEVAAKKKQAERELKARRAELKEDEEDPSETVYRDSSGRKIDTKREKAEMAKRKRDELESEMKKMEWGKGVVQKEDKARRKREEEAMKARPIARYADDKDMNNEMKDVDRWNDPAAGFLTVSVQSYSDRLHRLNC
jgi:pre-mRNA-splicing factor CWC26